MLLSINQLSLEWQDAEYISEPEHVQQIAKIAAAMLRADPIEPVIVYYDGDTFRLFDGFHRVAAAKKAGRTQIEAEVRGGGLAEMKAEEKRGWDAIKKANASFAREYRLKTKK
jgi:ParB-like chromosome segregation protein Spo0J